LMGLLLIILISMAFSFFNSFWGMFLSGGLIILAIIPLSFLFFRSGVWLDFAAPLTAIQLHQIAARIEEYRKKSNPLLESINGALI
jgi:CHASE2 domain-containing sensor protein